VAPHPHAVGASAVTAAGNMPGDSFSASPCCIFARCDSSRRKSKKIFSCARASPPPHDLHTFKFIPDSDMLFPYAGGRINFWRRKSSEQNHVCICALAHRRAAFDAGKSR